MKMKVKPGMGGTGTGRYTTREDAKTTCRKQRRHESKLVVREQLAPDHSRRVSERFAVVALRAYGWKGNYIPAIQGVWATLEDAQRRAASHTEPWWEPLQVMPAAQADRLPGLQVLSRCFTVE